MNVRWDEVIAALACIGFVLILAAVALWSKGWLLEFLMPRIWQ
jgi:hypothetical protein